MKKNKIAVIFISVILFLIPFFWMKPGEMDLGGDFSRLYFYDPVNYLKNFGLYSIFPEGTNRVEPNQFYLPFLLVLIAAKSLFNYPYILISIINGLKLAVSFLSIYLIVKEFISFWKPKSNFFTIEAPAIIAGLFYLSTPAVMANMDKALLSHDQVFLNPLIFYLVLRYLLTGKYGYLWFAIGTSFIFAANFAWFSAPPFFAFYPLALLFLFLYVRLIRHKSLPWRGIIAGIIFMLGLHAFHLIPEAVSLLDKGSYTNLRFFDQQAIIHEGLEYFNGVLPISKLSIFFLLPPMMPELTILAILAPLLMIFGLKLNHPKQKDILLTAFFFLITFFLISAKITNLGVELYRRLFYIPGFSMFRNFIGQWQFIYAFFFALLLGQSLARVLARLGKQAWVIFTLSVIVIIALSWKLYDGESMNKTHFTSSGVKIVMRMDPKYEQFLAYVRSLPGDGKILMLPFSDYAAQVLHGTNNGAYVGPSMISYLAGKSDFSGYNRMLPFSEIFLYLARTKNYSALKQILAILNVKYIFYNSDPNVYDNIFPKYPYSYVRKSLPSSQAELANFVQNIAGEKLYQNSYYQLYLTDSAVYLPQIYIPQILEFYEYNPAEWDGKADPLFLGKTSNDALKAYLLEDDCRRLFNKMQCQKERIFSSNGVGKMEFYRLNPTQYKIKITGATAPYFLVFANMFHRDWKAYLQLITSGDYQSDFRVHDLWETRSLKPLPEERHFKMNGYANGWYIIPEDTQGKTEYIIILEMIQQRIFYVSLVISAVALVLFCGLGLVLLRKADLTKTAAIIFPKDKGSASSSRQITAARVRQGKR